MSWLINRLRTISKSSQLLTQVYSPLVDGTSSRCQFSLWEMHVKPTFQLRKEHEAAFKKPLLDGKPQMKGVVLKTLIKKPKKPNSGNRKSVLVRLTNGKEVTAYVPGEGHNIQEHNILLIRGGRTQDVPGLKLKVVRGAYDCPHVKK